MGGDDGSLPASEAPSPQGDMVRTRMAQIQACPPLWQREDGLPLSFSQNPKQVLVMPDFWYVRRRNFRHQRRLPCRRQVFAGAPYTFSSTVQAPSWVPCTFSSTALAQSQVLSAPFLRRCRPLVGFFCCLSYGHVKVLRSGSLTQHLGAAANLSSVFLLWLYLYSLVFSFYLRS